MKAIRIAAAQTPEFREDVDSALEYLAGIASQAEDEGASLLCLPEGFLQGYLTEEGAARRQALDLNSPAFRSLLDSLPLRTPTIVFGMIEVEDGSLFNTAAVVKGRRLIGRYRKRYLLRGEQCFNAGSIAEVFGADGLRFGINICYDTNFPEAARSVADLGASLLVCPANNMLSRVKAEQWKDVHNSARGERCRETGLWLVSADVTGERDGKIGWGPTAVLNPRGEVVVQLPLGEPGLLAFDLPIN